MNDISHIQGDLREMAMDSKSIVIIGASTGGFKALGTILTNLPELNSSIIIVQHMPKCINDSVKKTLNRDSHMEVKIAEDEDGIQHGKVYLAPSEVHLTIMNNRRIRLFNGAKVN